MVLALFALVAALRAGQVFAVPTVLALMAVALVPVARVLERRGVGRGAAAGWVVFGTVAALAALLYWLAPSAEGFGDQLPGLAQRMEAAIRSFERGVGDLAGSPRSASPDTGENGAELVESGRQAVVDGLLAAPAVVGAVLYAVCLAYFPQAERARIARTVLLLAQSDRTRRALLRAMRDVRSQVSTYLLTITLINVLLGASAGAAFWLLGLPNAPIWGLALGLLNYMPYIGPALVAVGVFAAGLASHGQPEAAAIPVLALLALNAVEGSFLTPRLVGRRVEVSALAVFVAIAFGAWLRGAAGAVIATPALIFLRAFGLRLAEALASGHRRARGRFAGPA